jgi:MoaA/NifB/PqqE/SkfB family radical SAM enzyme
MTRDDWIRVLGEAPACGVPSVQFIGGEPTMHPDFLDLVEHALNLGLHVEVFSNLVHVPDACWTLFQHQNLALATSYYSDDADTHNALTGRSSHRKTRANIARAVRLQIPLRVGIIGTDPEVIAGARRDMEGLGVTRIGVDHVRPFGRGGEAAAPDAGQLCGRCGIGRASIGPTGEVSPCVFSGWMSVGNIQEASLDTVLTGPAMAEARQSIRSGIGEVRGCEPDAGDGPCYPDNAPCGPDQSPIIPCGPDDTCSPGVPCGPAR